MFNRMTNYKYLGEFRFWVQKVLPLVYDDSLSYYELLSKVVKYINDLIDNFNTIGKTMEELIDYVNNYFENLKVPEEVERVIHEMYENGDFDEIFQRLIDDTLDELNLFKEDLGLIKNAHLTFGCNRLFRVLKNRYRYGTPEYIEQFNVLPFSLQGSCYANNSFVMGYTNADGTRSLLEERNMTGDLIRSANLTLGHCNSITKKDNELYICPLSENGDIIVVDYNSFTISRIVRLPVEFRGLGYDSKTNVLYGVSANDYYIVDINNASVEKIFTSYNIGDNVPQSICAHNGLIYEVTSGPDMLSIYRPDGRVVQNYSIDDWMGFNFFGEAEDITVTDTDIYLSSNYQFVSDNYRHCAIWNYNIEKGYVEEDVGGEFDLGFGGYNSIYVNAGASGTNPDGSQENPFKCLSEAFIYLSSPYAQDRKTVDIRIASGVYYEKPYLRQFNIRMIGEGETNPIIKTCMYLYGTNIYVENIEFENNDPRYNYTIELTDSIFREYGCTVRNTTGVEQEYGIGVSMSIAQIQGEPIETPADFTYPINSYLSPIYCTYETTKNLITGSNFLVYP